MVKRFLFVVFLFACCKASEKGVKSTGEVFFEKNQEILTKTSGFNPRCVLSELPKTSNYKSEIEKYFKIYKDTIIQFERIEFEVSEYRTVFDLRRSEYFVWLIKSHKAAGIDSILIDALSPTKGVVSYFDLEDCTIENVVDEFHPDGAPKSGTTAVIEL